MHAIAIYYYLQLAISWAILIGAPLAYVAACVYASRRIPGKAGVATGVVLIVVPAAWLLGINIWFLHQCGGHQLTYHQRDRGVEGVTAIGEWAQAVLRDEVSSKDGYLFYDKPSRYTFEVSEPRTRNAWLYLSESRLEIRDIEKGTVVAHGTDILLGGFLLDRLHGNVYGNKYLACGPGIEPGGWRHGRMRGKPHESSEQFVRRDREFLRTALIPSRSAAAFERTLDDLVRVESPMSFQRTLWTLAKAIAKEGSYEKPVVFFRGDLPAHLPPTDRARARDPMGGEDEAGDPDLANARYWANVAFGPKQHQRELEMPRIRVIQRADSVVVKALHLRNRDEIFGTETLDYRRQLHRDRNRLVRAAIEPPAVPVTKPFATTLASRFTFNETIDRILERVAAEPGYRALRQGGLSSSTYGGQIAVRVTFAREDGALMARIFSFDNTGYSSTLLYVDVIVDDKGAVTVNTAALSGLFPKDLPQAAAASYAAEARGLVASALTEK